MPLQPSVDEREVVGSQPLGSHVEFVDVPAEFADVVGAVCLARREALQTGDADLDDEAATRLELLRDTAEASDLRRPASSGS